MNPVRRWVAEWRARRDADWWDRYSITNRWAALADYNSRVHTPEYATRMAEEQAAFNRERFAGDGFPFTLEPRR